MTLSALPVSRYVAAALLGLGVVLAARELVRRSGRGRSWTAALLLLAFLALVLWADVRRSHPASMSCGRLHPKGRRVWRARDGRLARRQTGSQARRRRRRRSLAAPDDGDPGCVFRVHRERFAQAPDASVRNSMRRDRAGSPAIRGMGLGTGRPRVCDRLACPALRRRSARFPRSDRGQLAGCSGASSEAASSASERGLRKHLSLSLLSLSLLPVMVVSRAGCW